MSVQTSARHRAAQRPSTPLSALGSAGQIGRRTAIVAASSGLVLTIAAPAAMASPEAAQAPQSASKAATQLARTTAPAVSSTVVVPSDAQWTIAETQVTATRPAPPPPPVVRETTTRSTAATASRSSARSTAAVSTTSAAQAAAPAPSVSGNAVLSIAYRYIGVPYVRGGSTPAGFDCSGFTQYVYAQLGISIPRSSAAQRGAGRVVSASEARPGDLVWWPGHVGIYVGNGQYIAARQPGTPLKVSPIYRSGATFIRVA